MSGRYFFAIDLEDNARARVSSVAGSLKGIDGARWVKPENYHLTLLFLGDRAADDLAKLCHHAKAIAAETSPFTLDLQGVGFFPDQRRPRVLYMDVCRGREAVIRLAGALHMADGQQAAKFRPHLTLARLRTAGPVRISAHTQPIAVTVREFILFSSTLTPSGPIYRPVQTFSLAGVVTGE